MALDVKAVGKKSAEKVFEYDWKRVVLYALGVGARVDELDFLYEGRGPKVLPTFAVIPAFESSFEVIPAAGGNIFGLVHGAQSVKIHKPIAPSGKLTTVSEIKGVYDLRKMASLVVGTETRDAKGELVFETEWNIIFRLDGNFDGPPPPPTEHVRPSDRAPDWRREETTTREQALLYRLSGYLTPLHADPNFAKASGFDRPILHGLCTFGHMGRAAVIHAAGGDPTKIAAIGGQFRKPVLPGDTLVTEGWQEGKRCVMRVTVKERDEAPIQNAYVDLV